MGQEIRSIGHVSPGEAEPASIRLGSATAAELETARRINRYARWHHWVTTQLKLHPDFSFISDS